MKTDIILAGVGGQGILSIAAVIGYAAVHKDLNLKQAEVHGMSQRGGAVQSNLRISDRAIHSDLISRGQADLILSVEPMEALRYLPWLSSNGWLVTNSQPYKNIPDYPEYEEIEAQLKMVPKHIIIDADGMAIELKSRKSSNMIVLGAAIPFLPFDWDDFQYGLNQLFGRKGQEIVDINLDALRAGKNYSEKTHA
jgi:indolepyruvate ferredoxin oxidoreductase beta subunit